MTVCDKCNKEIIAVNEKHMLLGTDDKGKSMMQEVCVNCALIYGVDPDTGKADTTIFEKMYLADAGKKQKETTRRNTVLKEIKRIYGKGTRDHANKSKQLFQIFDQAEQYAGIELNNKNYEEIEAIVKEHKSRGNVPEDIMSCLVICQQADMYTNFLLQNQVVKRMIKNKEI